MAAALQPFFLGVPIALILGFATLLAGLSIGRMVTDSIRLNFSVPLKQKQSRVHLRSFSYLFLVGAIGQLWSLFMGDRDAVLLMAAFVGLQIYHEAAFHRRSSVTTYFDLIDDGKTVRVTNPHPGFALAVREKMHLDGVTTSQVWQV